MPDFEYIAREKSGGRVTGTLTAGGVRDVMQLLEDKGLYTIAVNPAKEKKQLLKLGGRKKKVSGRSMVRFYRQLADLLTAGVPLLKSLELMERQSAEATLSEALAEIRRAVADGEGLAESMGKYPEIFGELALSMIRAGQEGGFLEDVLARIADYTEQEDELKGKIAGSMAYPIFLFLIGSSVITILIVFFVPKFEQIFERLREKGQLPMQTIALLGLSKFLQTYGIFLIAAFVAAIVALQRWLKTPQGREKLDRFKITAPKLGEVFRNLAIVRFCRVLGTLLTNGIPILAALRIAKDSCGNVVLSKAISEAADSVTSGESLTEPLRLSGYFPREMIEMVTIAEESNTLEKVLLDISTSTEKRTTRQLELFVRLLEPMMLLVMAIITLAVVSALLLPVMKMSSALK